MESQIRTINKAFKSMVMHLSLDGREEVAGWAIILKLQELCEDTSIHKCLGKLRAICPPKHYSELMGLFSA